MKTLSEHDAQMRERYVSAALTPRRNGIACPICAAELFDTDPNIQLMSYPPQTAVHCASCDWRGYRVV